MEMLYQRCCGLDVHKRMVVACLLTTASDGTVNRQVRTFGTMTADLLALAEWLDAAGCTHIAMESTGVFWKPIYNPHSARSLAVLSDFLGLDLHSESRSQHHAARRLSVPCPSACL